MLIHREALELAKNAAPSGDGIPFAITCVQVTTDGAVTVTDGSHWLRMKAAADEPNLFDELAEKDTETLAGPVLVPAEVMSAFRAAMKRRKSKKGEPVPHVVVAQQDNRVTLRSSDGKTMRTFLLEAVGADLKFPDIERTVRGAYKPVRHVVLSVDILRLVMRTLHACKVGWVTLGFPEHPSAPISLTAWSETGPIDGAIMPAREDPSARQPAAAAAPRPEAASRSSQGQQPRTVIQALKETIDQVTGEITDVVIPDGLQKAVDNLIGSGLASVSVGGKTTHITPEMAKAARKRKAARKKGAKA
jgi:hypothetical protein